MKITRVRIERYRGFDDETITVNAYTCFVGPNGSGKSTILAALNVFFLEPQHHGDAGKLTEEDYFRRDTSRPVRITLTFADLSQAAQVDLADYVRQNELTVTIEAAFDPNVGFGQVRHFGQRLGMSAFRPFFEEEKKGASAASLGELFETFRAAYPEIRNARTKEERGNALREYEATHPEDCELIPSQDSFYGINSTGKLARFVQWVYVPAVKDAGDEELESRNTALGKLMSRAVQARTQLDSELDSLRQETSQRYQELLAKNQAGLNEVAASLKGRLQEWAHPDIEFGLRWVPAQKAVQVDSPMAGVQTGEAGFVGSLGRMGHGLQRSYLLALLQELAASEAPDAPTLLLGCEEPELYQHPPQARHLSNVLEDLAGGNNQIILTSHSPYFVKGAGFENVRVVRRVNPAEGSHVRGLTLDSLCTRLRAATGGDEHAPTAGLVAKINQSLQPAIAEMLFARVAVLVEGLEDEAYLTTQLHLDGLWSDFRRLGCHIVPAQGKDQLIRPLAIAIHLGLPTFVVFDADGDVINENRRPMHERDNKALLDLLGVASDPFPAATLWGNNYVVWPTNLTKVVREEFGEAFNREAEPMRLRFADEGGLEKNSLFIAAWLTEATNKGDSSESLKKLCQSVIAYVKEPQPTTPARVEPTAENTVLTAATPADNGSLEIEVPTEADSAVETAAGIPIHPVDAPSFGF